MLVMVIDLSWLRILRYLSLLYFIAIFVWDIYMLIVSIAHFALLSIVILICAMIVLIALHVWIHCCISFYLTHWFSGLYILLIVFEHGVCIIIHPDHHSLYVYMSDISCTLLDCMLHDYFFSVLLHVICPCGPHIYPLISNPLVSSFFSFRFSLLQVWGLGCACSLTEPGVRSRV